MRINDNIIIGNINCYKYNTLPEQKYDFFTNTFLPEITIYPYYASEKYFELQELLDKYDLMNNISGQESAEILFAAECRKDFKQQYGIIKSSSMQQLLLDESSPAYEKTLLNKINKMRDKCRSFNTKQYVNNLEKQIKLRGIGNCTDISALSINNILKKNSVHKGELIYATMVKDKTILNHAAVLIKSKNSDDELNKDSIILDNWLGGIFKYQDWIKIMKTLYNTRKTSTYIDTSFWIELTENNHSYK